MEANKTPLLEVLNNLASIHHELRNDQTQLMDIDKLGRLKLLAAQLYMEVDIELLSMEFPDLQEPVAGLKEDESFEAELDSVSDVVIDLFVPEAENTNMELPFAEVANEIEVTEEVLASPEAVIMEFEAVEEIGIVEEVTAVEEVKAVEEIKAVEGVTAVEEVGSVTAVEVIEIVEQIESIKAVESVVEVVAVQEVPVIKETAVTNNDSASHSDKANATHTVAGIIGQFPLSRRFEFSNILFGGDMDNMGLFVQEIIDAPDAAARGDVYERWFEQKQWRRRDESASDMWRMIKRIFTQ
ncbi:MAG: hypothetical protein ACO3A5_05205 [Bacteroidia bacterium]